MNRRTDRLLHGIPPSLTGRARDDAIRWAVDLGVHQQDLASHFGVSQTVISRNLRRAEPTDALTPTDCMAFTLGEWLTLKAIVRQL